MKPNKFKAYQELEVAARRLLGNAERLDENWKKVDCDPPEERNDYAALRKALKHIDKENKKLYGKLHEKD